MAPVAKIPSGPQNVSLMITRRCNLHCLHCSAAPEQFLRDDMTTKEILHVVEELAACQVFRVIVTGGEPLLHPDFFTIVNAIARQPIRMQINTNGTLVTPETIRRLQALPRRPRVLVSLDGITAPTYDRVRGPGRFEHMRRGIRLLIEGGFHVAPFAVISRVNFRELPAIAEFAHSLGTGSIKIVEPVACGRAPQHAAEMALKAEELPELLELVLLVDKQHPGLLNGGWLEMARFYCEFRDGKVPNPGGNHRVFTNCGAGWLQVAVACDGTVTPCELAHTYRCGNVRDQSFLEIWRNSPALKALCECRGMPLKQVRGCETCGWQHVCAGPCPAGGFTTFGVWPAADAVCLRRQIGTLLQGTTVVQEKEKVC